MNEIDNVVVEDTKIWETFSRDQIEQIIQGNIRSMEEKANQLWSLLITSGYYLRRQHEEKQYLEAGYKNFEAYVNDRYGKSLSWASRLIKISKKFSIGGNDPRIDPAFKEFGKSQLQEMLSLTDKQLEQVTPDMTVKEIRALKAPEPVEEEQLPGQMCVEDYPEVMPEQAEDVIKPVENVIESVESVIKESDEDSCADKVKKNIARCITGKSGSGYCGAAAYCNEPVDCCGACDKDCNGRCGWLEDKRVPESEIDFKALDKAIAVATSQKEECCESVMEPEPLPANSITTGTTELPDEVIDAEYTEVTEEITPQYLFWQKQRSGWRTT